MPEMIAIWQFGIYNKEYGSTFFYKGRGGFQWILIEKKYDLVICS